MLKPISKKKKAKMRKNKRIIRGCLASYKGANLRKRLRLITKIIKINNLDYKSTKNNMHPGGMTIHSLKDRVSTSLETYPK